MKKSVNVFKTPEVALMLRTILTFTVTLFISSCTTVGYHSTNTLAARINHDVNSLLEEQLLDGEAATWNDRQEPHVQRTLAVFLSYLEGNKICRDYFTSLEIGRQKYSPAFGTSCRISAFNWQPIRWSYVKIANISDYSHVDHVLNRTEVVRENHSQPSYQTYREFTEIDNTIRNVAPHSNSNIGRLNINRNIMGANYVYPYRLSPNLSSLITKKQKQYKVNYKSLIESSCKNHDVNPVVVYSIIKQESMYNPNAKSGAGAVGLMQLMPGTAEDMGVKNRLDPRQNVTGGVKYFRWLLDRKVLKNKVSFALAAYNCGIGNVEKHIKRKGYSIPSCRRNETRDYVRKITKTINECAKYN